MDVGGGLGIDYEGTRSRSYYSINYGVKQYALNIVQPLAEACAEHGLTPPRIVTECGRAMTAHHAVLVANVSEVERAPEGRVPDAHDDEPAVIRHLREIHAELDARPAVELFHEAEHHHSEGLSAYALGQIDLTHRARIDDLFYAIAHAVRERLNAGEKSHQAVLDELNQRLVDKYFVNFSVFESMPDIWAIEQVFPIVPIERLDEAPTRRGVIADLTCDSDGTHRHLRRERDAQHLDADPRVEAGRELPARLLPGRRVPGDPRRHPQPVRRHRCGRSARRRRRATG